MHDLIFHGHKDGVVNKLKVAFGVMCCLVVGVLECCGEPSSLAPQIMSAQQQVKWSIGPVKADLGKVAEVELPAGYRLTDAAGARILLERMKNPVPPGLLGILTPESGAWWVVVEFSELGYVSPATAKHINAETILTGLQTKIQDQNRLRAKQGAPPILSVNWELEPEYNAADDSLAYAIQIASGTQKIINQSVRVFGRNGVLAATVVQKADGTPEKAALRDLIKSVSFKAGQRLGDHQEGDKVASVDIYQLITGDEQTMPSPKTGWAKFFDRRTTIWIVSGLAVCVLALVVYLVTKEIRSLNPRNSRLPLARNGAAGKMRAVRRSATTEDAVGRRRAFDYQKFYSDMMMQVSTRSYTGLVNQQQEVPAEEVSPAAPATLVSAWGEKGAASELIARQKDFIEEQRRLMQQQTKLIEERSKLIEEKNQLLAKQSEMMENHLL